MAASSNPFVVVCRSHILLKPRIIGCLGYSRVAEPVVGFPKEPLTVVPEKGVFAKVLHDAITDIVNAFFGHAGPTN